MGGTRVEQPDGAGVELSYRTTYAIEAVIRYKPGHGVSMQEAEAARQALHEQAKRLGVPLHDEDMAMVPRERGITVLCAAVLVVREAQMPPSVRAMQVEHDHEERAQRG